jgi:type II secretory pathway pseudopilin PulG
MELLVVIVIIAVLAGLIFPVVGKMRMRAVETRTVSNLKQVGVAMSSYITEHDDSLPGPLTQEQYPTYGTDETRDKGSLAKFLAPYLSQVKKEGMSATAQTTNEASIFVCPGASGPNLDEIVGYIMNIEEVPDYKQPAWGKMDGNLPPLRRAALGAWRDTSTTALSTDSTVMLSRKWAMRHTDQKDCEKLKITAQWTGAQPKQPVFEDHYQALFFDWHVEHYKPNYANLTGDGTDMPQATN